MISQIERDTYDQNINMHWQKKVWVDREVMIEIARKFTVFKRNKHVDDNVLLFANNLDTHYHQLVLDFLHNKYLRMIYCFWLH